jgi:hypothetical protein
MKNIITRSEYIKGGGTKNHRQYYAQFVNEAVKAKVVKEIGLATILSSKDEHLNDIPLKKWDKLGGFVWQVIRGEERAITQPRTPSDVLPVSYELLKEAGEGVSSSTMVCIYKEAARQLKEEYKPPIDTWVIDCIDYECDGHMELQEVVFNYNDPSRENGDGEVVSQVWMCDKCGEQISDIEREDREIEAYKIH